MYAKNYRKWSLFEKVMAKIKRCSFFAPQCTETQSQKKKNKRKHYMKYQIKMLL